MSSYQLIELLTVILTSETVVVSGSQLYYCSPFNIHIYIFFSDLWRISIKRRKNVENFTHFLFLLHFILLFQTFISFRSKKNFSIYFPRWRPCTGGQCGRAERRLINDLMMFYQKLERPVVNESDAIQLKFGLTLQQIMNVVRDSNKA